MPTQLQQGNPDGTWMEFDLERHVTLDLTSMKTANKVLNGDLFKLFGSYTMYLEASASSVREPPAIALSLRRPISGRTREVLLLMADSAVPSVGVLPLWSIVICRGQAERLPLQGPAQ